jgi:hypothetical protein
VTAVLGRGMGEKRDGADVGAGIEPATHGFSERFSAVLAHPGDYGARYLADVGLPEVQLGDFGRIDIETQRAHSSIGKDAR